MTDDHREAAVGLDFEHLFTSLASPMALLAGSARFELLAVNDAYCEMTGRSRASLVGTGLFDAFPDVATEGGEEALRASFDSALTQGTPQVMPLHRYDIDDGNGMSERYWSITNTPVTDPESGRRFILIHPEEVTSFVPPRLAREATGTPPSTAGQTRAVNTVFTATIERLQHLNDLTAALVGSTTADEVSRALLRDGLGLAAAAAGSVISKDGNRFDILAVEGLTDDLATAWKSFPFAPGTEPFSDAIESGEPAFFACRDDFLSSYPHLAEYLEDDHHAWAVLPFRDGERTLGAFGLIYTEQTDFDHTHRLLLYTIASLASQAMSRARLISEQTMAIQSFDRALLDMVVDDIDDFVVSGLYRPSSLTITAGGDWYDIVELTDTTTLIVIGDIASHGPTVVGEMAHARSVVRAVALGGSRSDDIATQTSKAIEHFGDGHATATIAMYDHVSRTLTWSSAGHPPAVFVPADLAAPVELLDAPHGAPLGFESDFGFSERLIQPGDRLILYTDGLVETPGVDLDQAFDHLTEFVEGRRRRLTVDDLFDEFHPQHQQADDVAIVSITWQR
ncbi:SpoIIE family protein phosphatase [Ilumatobacter sp.]|uniref:PP2C family protein-serine/threonine phosphatase n=1 Tax=Ilumatobacter sp. TaxID=1967498 RepID=UPI003C546CF2